MKNILPMAIPAIKCYANYAHISSILGEKSKNYYPWIYNHYIQLYVPDDYKEFPVDYMVTGMYTNTPNLFTSRIERGVAVNIRNGIINFIRFSIDNGYYIYMELEVEKIAAYANSGLQFHDPLLYGYDDEKEEIYFADTYINGKYSKGIASYSEMVNATGNVSDWSKFYVTDLQLDILCMKYRDLKKQFLFCKDTYTELLTYYVNKIDARKYFWEIPGVTNRGERANKCGIGIYNVLKKHLQFVKASSDRLIDKRGFYVILEHKKLLEKSLEFLLGNGWKEVYPLEARLIKKEIEDATICLQLCLKYNITKADKIVDKINEYAIELEETEKVLFPNLIRIVENAEL